MQDFQNISMKKFLDTFWREFSKGIPRVIYGRIHGRDSEREVSERDLVISVGIYGAFLEGIHSRFLKDKFKRKSQIFRLNVQENYSRNAWNNFRRKFYLNFWRTMQKIFLRNHRRICKENVKFLIFQMNCCKHLLRNPLMIFWKKISYGFPWRNFWGKPWMLF